MTAHAQQLANIAAPLWIKHSIGKVADEWDGLHGITSPRDARTRLMVWLCFVRDGKALRLEARFDVPTGDYMLTLEEPGGCQRIERFRHAATLRRRLMQEEVRLEAECWRRRPVRRHCRAG
jgi:hypothetical protein